MILHFSALEHSRSKFYGTAPFLAEKQPLQDPWYRTSSWQKHSGSKPQDTTLSSLKHSRSKAYGTAVFLAGI
jgi:hypothetical protein